MKILYELQCDIYDWTLYGEEPIPYLLLDDE